MLASSDAASKLMKLGQAVLFGAFDQHHRRIGNIETHLDDAGGEQDLDLVGAKCCHHLLLLFCLQFAVQQAEAKGREFLLQALKLESDSF